MRIHKSAENKEREREKNVMRSCESTTMLIVKFILRLY